MGTIGFGIFDHIDKQRRPLGATFEDRLRLLAAAEAAGFTSYHLAEHHATPLCMAPSPNLFLAALAQRTQRLRFGPLVYLLPLYDPLRLIEEICMLDQLSGGRFELGVGRGISPIELGFHGLDPAEAPARFAEVLDILLAGLGQTRLTHHGRFYDYTDVPIELAPVQRPHPPLWYATAGLERIPWLASRNINMVVQGPAERVRGQLDRYWQHWSGSGPRPKLGVLRTIVVAETDAEALALARAPFREHYTSLVKLWNEHNLPTAAESFTPDLDKEIGDDKAYVGSPSTVRDHLTTFFDRTGCDYLIVRPMFGNLPYEAAHASLHLLATEVMPAFAPTAIPT